MTSKNESSISFGGTCMFCCRAVGLREDGLLRDVTGGRIAHPSCLVRIGRPRLMRIVARALRAKSREAYRSELLSSLGVARTQRELVLICGMALHSGSWKAPTKVLNAVRQLLFIEDFPKSSPIGELIAIERRWRDQS